MHHMLLMLHILQYTCCTLQGNNALNASHYDPASYALTYFICFISFTCLKHIHIHYMVIMLQVIQMLHMLYVLHLCHVVHIIICFRCPNSASADHASHTQIMLHVRVFFARRLEISESISLVMF